MTRTGYVIAQGLGDDLVLLQRGDGLAERAGHLGDALLGHAGRVHLEEALLDRLGELHALLDAVETGSEHRREREVGVRRGIGAADLDARRLCRPAG